MATISAPGPAGHAEGLSTRELLGEITEKIGRIARKEVELARTEIKADVHSQIGLVKGLEMKPFQMGRGIPRQPLCRLVVMSSPSWRRRRGVGAVRSRFRMGRWQAPCRVR